jgi:hypothetical protein
MKMSCHSQRALPILKSMLLLLLAGLTASAVFAQAPTSRAVPYYVSVFAGIPGEASNSYPYTIGVACPSGKIPTTIYGDGCLASEAVFYAPYAIVFDAAGNAYIADTDSSGNFGFIRKVDAVTGIITQFVGGLTGAVTSPSTGPCTNYTDGTHTGPDPA